MEKREESIRIVLVIDNKLHNATCFGLCKRLSSGILKYLRNVYVQHNENISFLRSWDLNYVKRNMLNELHVRIVFFNYFKM
jgi:hypothetical protein